MGVQRLSVSGVGASASLGPPTVMQDWVGNAGVSLLVNFSGPDGVADAVATVSVRLSNDPLAVNSPLLARWNNHDVLVNLTADANSTLAAPVYGIQLNCTSWTSGTVTLDVGWGDQR